MLVVYVAVDRYGATERGNMSVVAAGEEVYNYPKTLFSTP
jgi:hypothetical protein